MLRYIWQPKVLNKFAAIAEKLEATYYVSWKVEDTGQRSYPSMHSSYADRDYT